MKRILMATTIINGNTLKDSVITVIALIPIIPGGFVMAFKYIKKVTIKINYKWAFHWYNQQNINNQFKIETGVELI